MSAIYRIFVLLIVVGSVIGAFANQTLSKNYKESFIHGDKKLSVKQEIIISESERKISVLGNQISLLASQKGVLENKLSEKDEIILRLKAENENLMPPKQLPLFQSNDIVNGRLDLKRIYSVKSGRCFDINANSSCFFATIIKGDSIIGYLLYKSNGAFEQSLIPHNLIDPDGNKLALLTQQNRETIDAWEEKNPNHPLRMSFY